MLNFKILNHYIHLGTRPNLTAKFYIFGPKLNKAFSFRTPYGLYLRIMSKYVYRDFDKPGYRVDEVDDIDDYANFIKSMLASEVRTPSGLHNRPIDEEWIAVGKKLAHASLERDKNRV